MTGSASDSLDTFRTALRFLPLIAGIIQWLALSYRNSQQIFGKGIKEKQHWDTPEKKTCHALSTLFTKP